MKGSLAVAVALCLLAHGSAAVIKGVATMKGVAHFGPKSCVSLTRSPEGTCVMSTDCQGVDISKTEFAFDCRVGKNIVRHSFGFGGFDDNEEFDAGLKCDQCTINAPPVHLEVALPKPMHHEIAPAKLPAQFQDIPRNSIVAEPVAPPAKAAKAPKVTPAKSAVQPLRLKANAKRLEPKKAEGTNPVTVVEPKISKESKNVWGASAKEGTAKTTDAKVVPTPENVRYGPNGCVSVYKSEAQHCIMSTECRSSDMANYEYGLVCVDKVGSPVKHLFGRDSFDPVETFDTLIVCNECLGLEDVPDGVALAGSIAGIAKAISHMKDAMVNISADVQLLNNRVFPSMVSAPAPAAATPTETELIPAETELIPAAAVEEATKLIHKSDGHSRHTKKRHLRHSKPEVRHSNSRFNRHRQHRKERVQEDGDGADEEDNEMGGFA